MALLYKLHSLWQPGSKPVSVHHQTKPAKQLESKVTSCSIFGVRQPMRSNSWVGRCSEVFRFSFGCFVHRSARPLARQWFCLKVRHHEPALHTFLSLLPAFNLLSCGYFTPLSLCSSLLPLFKKKKSTVNSRLVLPSFFTINNCPQGRLGGSVG